MIIHCINHPDTSLYHPDTMKYQDDSYNAENYETVCYA